MFKSVLYIFLVSLPGVALSMDRTDRRVVKKRGEAYAAAREVQRTVHNPINFDILSDQEKRKLHAKFEITRKECPRIYGRMTPECNDTKHKLIAHHNNNRYDH